MFLLYSKNCLGESKGITLFLMRDISLRPYHESFSLYIVIFIISGEFAE